MRMRRGPREGSARRIPASAAGCGAPADGYGHSSRVSNNSGTLFFTLLIARPSGRSCSTSLAGHIRAAASSGAARSQASMSSSSLYRISWVLLVAQGQSEGVGWNADSACRRFTVRLLYSQMVAWTLRSVKEVLSSYMVAKQGIVLQYRRA